MTYIHTPHTCIHTSTHTHTRYTHMHAHSLEHTAHIHTHIHTCALTHTRDTHMRAHSFAQTIKEYTHPHMHAHSFTHAIQALSASDTRSLRRHVPHAHSLRLLPQLTMNDSAVSVVSSGSFVSSSTAISCPDVFTVILQAEVWSMTRSASVKYIDVHFAM